MKKLLIICSLISIIPTTIFSQIPTDGLVGYWSFTGNADDESGNNHHGTVNGATLTQDRFGNPNSAYSYNGEDNFIDLGNLGGYSSHTFSGWLKIEGQQNSYGVLVSKLYNDLHFAKNSEIRIDQNRGDGYHISSQLGTGSTWEGEHIDIPIDSTVWHHFAYMYDDNEKSIKVYLDNEIVDSIVISGYSDVPTTPTYIGARPYWNGPTVFFFNGYIDDISVYNRALNIDEIESMYFDNMCSDTMIHDTIIYYVSSNEFEVISPKIIHDSIQNLVTVIGGCDSVIHNYSKFVYDPNYCSDTTYVTVTDSISVIDTLVIDAVLTGINPPNNINTLKIYPNPAKDHLFINTGDYTKMDGYQLKIINQLGSVVFETNVEESLYEVNLSTWSGMGLYYVQVIDSGGTIIDIRKIVLQ